MVKKDRFFRWFPNCVVNHPKKVISVFIVFTIVMGFYASGMEMDTDEESFQPESGKQEYLQTIQDRFGRTDEAVQIAFTADGGDVFTVDVLHDMLEMEQALLEDETVNRTLAKSTEMPTGMNTLAGNILLADQAFLLEDYVIQQGLKTHETLAVVENQTKMYEKMNESFAMNLYLYNLFSETHNLEGIEGTNKTMISMAQIVPEPRLWDLVLQYQGDFMELMHNLSSIEDHYDASLYLENWLDEMGTTTVAHSPFYDLVDGTKITLGSETITDDQKNISRGMVLTFFGISEHLELLQEPIMDGLEGDAPSLTLSTEEKKEKLSEMTDEDIKRTVSDVNTYDPSRLNDSINEGVNNLEEMEEYADSSLDNLGNLEDNLEQTIESLQLTGQNWHIGVLEIYHESVNENLSMVIESNQMFAESKTMLRDSIRLSHLIRQMGGMISSTVSRDYSPTDDFESISAKSSIGIAFLDREFERDERLEAQKRIIELGDQEPENSEIRVSAQQVMMEEINESANRSLQRLLPAAFVIVVIILLIVYRSLLETVLSLGSLGIAIVWTFGFGVLLGYEFNPMIIAVPILITGLVIDYGIHMVMRYREEKDDGYHPKTATKITIATVGGALILTTFTTAVGFLSNTLSNILVMRQFGVLAAVGITSSFLLMIAFLPAVLQLVDERENKGNKSSKNKSKRDLTDKIDEKKIDVISRALTASADAADSYPLAVLIVVILITTASIYGVVNIDSTFNIQDFLPEDQPQSQNIMYIQDNFNVTTSYAHILTEGEVDSPQYLYALQETRENIRDSDMVGGDGGDVMSPLTVLQRFGTAPRGSSEYNATIVQAFSDSDTNNDGIPDRNVTELFDMLFDFEESRSAVMNVIYRTEDGEYTSGRIRLLEDQRSINEDLANAEILEQELEDDVKPLKDEGFTAKITSGSMIGHDTTAELTSTQLRSLLVTIIVVAISLSVVFYFLHKSILLGIITTAPVAIITLWIVGTMYITGVSLNVMTVSITALTVGMGVDYSIHITHRFNEERLNSDLYEAVHETVQNTGAALFGSAMTTVAAFGILSTSDILPLSQFGYITALAITYSFLAAVFILPSALMLWAKNSNDVKKE